MSEKPMPYELTNGVFFFCKEDITLLQGALKKLQNISSATYAQQISGKNFES